MEKKRRKCKKMAKWRNKNIYIILEISKACPRKALT
jgi:hypothetical protein